MNLTEREKRALSSALRTYTMLDQAGIGSSRRLRRSVLEGLVDKGLMVAGVGVLVDGDGWARQPEREREAFFLTDLGRELAEQLEDQQEENHEL